MILSFPRRLALGLPVLCVRPARAAPASVRFKVVREGREAGFHRVTVVQDGASLRAVAEIEIVVRLLSFTVFRYRVDAEEVWRDGRLFSVQSQSEKQGRANRFVAQADAGGIAWEGTAGRGRLPPDAAPLTWWREASMRQTLFDPATGVPLPAPPLRAAAGAGVRWSVTADPGGEASYAAADGAWISFSTKGEDGSAIVYQPG